MIGRLLLCLQDVITCTINTTLDVGGDPGVPILTDGMLIIIGLILSSIQDGINPGPVC